MAQREPTNSAIHDTVIRHISRRYRNRGYYVSINPGAQRNEDWNGRYVDVIVEHTQSDEIPLLIEVETRDSVTQSEAQEQWIDYSSSFERWYLAVPSSVASRAERLLNEYDIHTVP